MKHTSTPTFKKITTGLLSVMIGSSLVLTPRISFASQITSSAEEALKSNKALADRMAQDLVSRDFNVAFQLASSELSSLDESQQKFNLFLKAQGELVNALKSFAALDLNAIEKSTEQIAKLNENYEDLVRLRFDLSWVPTDVADKYRLVGPLLKDVVARFKARCETGRSDISFDTTLPQEPMPPKYQFEFVVNYDGQRVTPSYAGLNYVDDHKERKQIIQAAGITAATSASILLTSTTGAGVAVAGGSSAAALAAASAAFPVASVVLITAIAVQHFANMNKANEIAAEVAHAEMLKFEQTKRDDYIAEKYRSLCKSNVVELQRISKLISMVESENTHAKAFVAREAARDVEMKALSKKISDADSAQCRLFLSNSVRKNECVQANASDEDKKGAVCQIDSQRQVTLISPQAACQIEAKEGGAYAGAEDDTKIANSVTAKDAQRLVYHKLVMSLGKNRDVFFDTVSRVNWGLVDEFKEQALLKLMEFNSLARRLNQAGLVKSDAINGLIKGEVAKAKTFESLRGRFVQLTADAIKVTFAGGAKEVFHQSFRAFKKEFEEFFRQNRLVKDVQALGASVRELERIMNATA